jgi:hypothetical protein
MKQQTRVTLGICILDFNILAGIISLLKPNDAVTEQKVHCYPH